MSDQRTIFITGAAGYLGQKTIARLRRSQPDWQIIGLDLKPMQREDERVLYLAEDLRQAPLEDWFKSYKVDQVLHLAAVMDGSRLSRDEQYEIDVKGTERILQACVAAGVQRVILSSSGAAYGYHADNPAWLVETDELRGNPVFAYSDHKRQVEEMAAQYRQEYPNLEQTILRFCTIIGKATDNLITKLFEQKKLLGLKGYASAFVFIWDEDAARVLEHSILSPVTGIYNVAGDGALPMRSLAQLLGKPYREMSVGLLYPILWLGRRLRLLGYGPEQLLFLQYRPVLDNRKLKEGFGFIPEKTSLQAFEEYARAKGMWQGSAQTPLVEMPQN